MKSACSLHTFSEIPRDARFESILSKNLDAQIRQVYQGTKNTICHMLPSIEEIVRFSNSDLVGLAHHISEIYTTLLMSASDEKKQLLLNGLPYGIKASGGKTSTIKSLAMRAVDKKWWRRKVIKIADEKREHLAHINKALGGRASTQMCCSDRTIEMYRERKERTEDFLRGCNKVIIKPNCEPYVFNLLEVAEGSKRSKLNELFLNIKALEVMAEASEFGCALVTLTASAEFHSNPKVGKDNYRGASAREANYSISKDWRSILDALDNIGIDRKSGDYFGFRVVEVHEDGCPHWHIAIFFNKELGILEEIEHAIERLYTRRGSYFEQNKQHIVKVVEKTDDKTATPSSYIFGYVLKALGDESDDTAVRYKCAIKAMGARQYAFFGIKCATSKQRALKKIARDADAPIYIKSQAQLVHPPRDLANRNELQLAARVDFFEQGANMLSFEKAQVHNKYGEQISTTIAIKHDLDDRSVIVAGLSEDISQAEAEKLRRRET